MKDLIQKKIIAMLPCYTSEGANFTIIKLLNDKEIILKKSISSTIKSLCQFYHYDLQSSKKTCNQMLGVKKTPPIAINKDMVFIAVKTRIPIGKNDGAYSYINIDMIKGIKDEEIDLKNGDILKVKSKLKTIEKNIKDARLLENIMANRQILIKEEQDIYMYEEDNIIEDLDIIYRKIQAIERAFLMRR